MRRVDPVAPPPPPRSLSEKPSSSAGFAGAIGSWGRLGGGRRGPLRWSRRIHDTPRGVASMRTRAASPARSGASAGTPRSARSTSPGGAARRKYLVRVVSRSSTIASLGQRRLQDGLAAGELTLDRVDGDAPDAGKVLVRKPVDVVERQDQPRLPRHPVETARLAYPLHPRR